MEHTQALLRKVAQSVVQVDHWRGGSALEPGQSERKGVHGEVAAPQIFFEAHQGHTVEMLFDGLLTFLGRQVREAVRLEVGGDDLEKIGRRRLPLLPLDDVRQSLLHGLGGRHCQGNHGWGIYANILRHVCGIIHNDEIMGDHWR